ncbi:hypothetical protein CRE_06668 [Caenorhabditis remanei]|uniref:Receptor L-domain domain-containing protein n=1 Tax=Caenorhabditis remanei TaxID=31234 RepID=E3M0U0_CAERE|nr:hypothetical protein CRE_06668 [Caenorhabditis remanei]
MKLIFFSYIFMFFPLKISSDFSEDLKTIVSTKDCDWECTFNYSEVTSKTIEYFPKKCEDVCAILTFNSNTDVAESELKKVFRQMHYLIGGLRFENSNITSLSFFTLLKVYDTFNFICDTFGLSIVNNSFLEDIAILQNFEFWVTSHSAYECPFQISNNTKLDTTDVCTHVRVKDWFGNRISGNSKDCVFQNLYDVLFGPLFINLENLHPDFCLTFEELLFFYEQRVIFNNIHAKYCPESKKRINKQKLCEIRNLYSLDDDCNYLFGDLVIDSFEGRYLYKLFNVNILFGSLKIQYTKLEGANFLYNLEYIASLNGNNRRGYNQFSKVQVQVSDSHPAILVRSNKYLKQLKLPNLKHVISRNKDAVVIEDNPVLFSSNMECLMYRITYATNLRVKNEACVVLFY